MRTGLLVGFFVIVMLVLFPASVAYTQSYDDSSPQQEGYLSSLGKALKSAAKKVSDALGGAAKKIGNAVKGLLGGGSESGSGNSGGTQTASSGNSNTGSNSNSGTNTNSGNNNGGGSGNTGSNTGSNNGNNGGGDNNGGGTTYRGGGSGGGGSGGGGSGGGGGSPSIFTKIVNFFKPPEQKPGPDAPGFGSKTIDFDGSETPFDKSMGDEKPKKGGTDTVVGMMFGGLSALGAWGATKYNNAKAASPAFNSVASTFEGFGKAIYLNTKKEVEHQLSVAGSVLEGDFRGAADKIVTKAKNDWDNLVRVVDEHKNEIIMAFAIGAAIGITVATLGAGSPISIAILVGAAAYTGYHIATTYPPLLQEVDSACTLDGCSDGGEALENLNNQTYGDAVIFGAGIAGGVVGGGAVGGLKGGPKGARLEADIGRVKPETGIKPEVAARFKGRFARNGKLTEPELRAFNEKYGHRGKHTPDEMTMRNGKVEHIKQETVSTGSLKTKANKIFRDTAKALKTPKEYGLETTENFKVTVEVKGELPPNMADIIKADIEAMATGGKPKVLAEGYLNKGVGDLHLVWEGINSGQVEIVSK